MIVEIGQIAATLVTTLTPFMPFLVDAGKISGQKFVETIAEKGGEAAWNKARTLWNKVEDHFGNDVEVTSAATMVAIKPDDERRQETFAEVLGTRLKEDTSLVEEFFNLLGGQQAIQQVLAERESWVENVTQLIVGPSGSQSTAARDNSTISGVKQNIQR